MSREVFLSGVVVLALLVALLLGVSSAYAAISRSLDVGANGNDVAELQAYLALDSAIYPEGLVTGYFGSLTQAAIQRFQVAQGIVSSGSPTTTGYGRVGPQTMARLNALMISGQTSWDAVPVLSVPLVQYGNTNATFTWATSEPTRGQVYYDSVPLRSDEATGPKQQPFVSGALAVDTSGGLQANHVVAVQNLMPNTIYYYLIRGIDSAGNLSMTWPNSFRTSQ